jgi:hypothetical protein
VAVCINPVVEGAAVTVLPVIAAGVVAAAAGVIFAAVDAVAAFGSVIALLMMPELAAAAMINVPMFVKEFRSDYGTVLHRSK